VQPTVAELAEDTQTYLPAVADAEIVVRPGFTYIATAHLATVHRIREIDIKWVRTETRRRGLDRVEWWVGWSSPPGTAERLVEAGFVPDEVPVLTGMTCSAEPPANDVDVTPVETLDDLFATLEVDWDVWAIDEVERAKRRVSQAKRFEEGSGVVHHWCAWVDGRRAGFGRAIDLPWGVALMGGAVRPELRGRGAYQALVRARWDHAAARGTPLLVVQASNLAAPALERLGFRTHGVLQLLVDPLVAESVQ
jgi:GNAT superfamily N-acetyltransferase